MKINLITPCDNSIVNIQRECHLDYIFRQNKLDKTVITDPIQWQNLVATNEDRSTPEDVIFEWEISDVFTKNVDFELHICKTINFENPSFIKKTKETKIVCSNFLLNQKYFWQVIAKSKDEIVGKSEVFSFRTSNIPPRWINVPGISNVRDIGGWQTTDGNIVKQGQVFRCTELNSHMFITDEGRKILLDDLKIKTDLDLRAPSEEIMPVLDESKVKWINFPIAPYYLIGQPEHQASYLECFKVFADIKNYPLIIHCWGGADRAGTVVFLLNGLLGVSRHDLSLDYELTSFSIWGERSRLAEDFIKMIDYLNTFGQENDSLKDNIEKYLLFIGVSKEEIEQIRKILI